MLQKKYQSDSNNYFKMKIPYNKKEPLEDIEKISAKVLEELFNLPAGKWDIKFEPQKITTTQMNSSWKFMTWLADALNESDHLWGRHFLEWFYREEFQMRWDKDLVKENLWNPIMRAYGVKSMAKLTTTQSGKIAEALQDNFAKKGILINFPNMDDFLKDVKPYEIIKLK